jgi:hypothetical protein
MIKVTNVVKCYTHPDDPGNDDYVDMVVENIERDTSHQWAKITVEGRSYQIDTRDLMDACRNVQNAGTR